MLDLKMYSTISICYILIEILVLVSTSDYDPKNKRNKICYEAKTCVHSGIERCAVNGEGKSRKFYDSCDILEYNCLEGADYTKTSYDKCASVTDIEDHFSEENDRLTEANDEAIPQIGYESASGQNDVIDEYNSYTNLNNTEPDYSDRIDAE